VTSQHVDLFTKLFNGEVLKSIVASNVCSSTPLLAKAELAEPQGLLEVEHLVVTSLIETLVRPLKV
jgi:hypothetical protein